MSSKMKKLYHIPEIEVILYGFMSDGPICAASNEGRAGEDGDYDDISD